jgi:hypothetical protein
LTAGNLTTTGTLTATKVSGTTVTDGIATLTAGNLTTTGTLTATKVSGTTVTDGTATITAGNLTTIGTLTAAKVTGTTVTDGIATITAGNLTSVGTITSTTSTFTAGFVTGALGTSPTSVMPKSYIDTISAGVKPVQSCACATTTNIDLSSIVATIDGYTLQNYDFVLVKNQTTGTQNGIYQWYNGTPPSGTFTPSYTPNTLWRPSSNTVWLNNENYPMYEGYAATGAFTYVKSGSTNSQTGFVQITNPGIVATDSLNFTAYFNNSNQAGRGLTLTSGTYNVDTTLDFVNVLDSNATLYPNVATGTLTIGQNATNVNMQNVENLTFTNTSGGSTVSINKIQLYSGYGFGISDSTINYITDGTHNFYVGNTSYAYINSSGLSASALTSTQDSSINGLTAGRGSGNISSNTVLGYRTLYVNTSGSQNTGVGYAALYNTTSYNNTAVGFNALNVNTSGNSNTGVGAGAIQLNTTGCSNIGVGAVALYNNSTGTYNTAIGTAASQNNTTGNSNTAVGYVALYTNSYGSNNTALGYAALYNTVGDSTTTYLGSSNTAVGINALTTNTTGYQNVAIGGAAFQSNTTGYYNVGLGYAALYPNTTGYQNVAIGCNAGSNGLTSASNTNCTFLGYNTGGNSTTISYNQSTAIGANAQITGNNQIVLGTSSETVTIPGTLSVTGSISGTLSTAAQPNITSVGTLTSLSVSGSISASSFVSTSTSTTTSSLIFQDYYSSATPPSINKIQLFTNYGFGISTNTLNYIIANNSSGVHNFYVNGASIAYINSSGVSSLSYTATSDYRVKDYVKPLDDTFTVDKLNPVTYYHNKLNKQDVGFIAHEVQEEYPFMVTGTKDGEDFQTLNYNSIIGILVKEIKDLKNRIHKLENKIDS